MNKIYRIVWNKARKTLMVVGDNARSVVKSSGAGTFGSGSSFAQWLRTLAAALAVLGLIRPPFALAQTVITPDGRTQTTVSNSGPVYGVSTATVAGGNAFNSFNAFTVGAGNTVNLQVPASALNLINIVRNESVNVYGVLNAIKNGQIGGNVWFADPHGFVVGASGVVNVGSLTVTTPTQQFVDNFFTAPNTPDPTLVTQLLSGTAPHGTGTISILGRINSIDGVTLSAGAIIVGGSIYSGAQFIGTAPDFTDVVNTNGLASGTNVVANGGHIEIVADGDVTVNASSSGIGTAAISVDGATVKGDTVNLDATAGYDNSLLPIQVPVVGASVSVNSSHLEATGGDLNLGATTSVNASTINLSPLASVTAVATASVDVGGTSALISGGATKLNATSTVTTSVTAATPDAIKLPGDAGAALNVVISTATAHLGGSTSVDAGGALEVTAHNTVTATTKADASASGATAAGGTVALAEVTSVTRASIDSAAAVTRSASLKVAADSANTVTTTAKAASNGATQQTAADKAANPSQTEATLAKYKDQASTSEGSVAVAAAVAVANVNSVTDAHLASSGQLTTSGKAEVTTTASNASTVSADGSSVGGTTGVGAAVALNIGVLTNQARIADNSRLNANGVTVSATMPTDGTNSFVTTAKSGAGASNVDVAGALGTNVLVNTTYAYMEGDTDGNGAGAAVNAGTGDIDIEAQNASTSTVTSGADVKGTGDSAKVGVGASVGLNVAVNTTTAEVQAGAQLTGGKDMKLNATADHTLSTEVTGGAAGAKVAVTPTAAVTVAVNTTTARLGTSTTGLNLSGGYASTADQKSSSTTKATGETEGSNVAVGASVALGISTDTASADVERDITAVNDVGVNAKSSAKSDTSATASVKGGEKTDTNTDKPASGDAGTVDKQVAAQGDAAKAAGKKAAEAAPAADAADAKAKLDDTKPAPKSEDNNSGGAVSVAAAVGANVEVATSTAKVGNGKHITSTAGALSVTSEAQTDGKAAADGSQVDNGNTNVGIGAAVALNVGVATNQALVSDNAVVDANGVTVSATTSTGEKNEFEASAKSGAGAANVGVAGSLAANVLVNTTSAYLEGDKDASGLGAQVDAGTGDMTIEAQNASTSTVTSGADVKGSGTSAKVGVGASVGLNVAVNTTTAEVQDGAQLTGGKDMTLNATGDHTLSTEVTGGAAGAKVAVTPLAAVTVAVNTTTARLGTSATGLNLSGGYSSTADQKSSVTTKATGTTEGSSVAVGASVALGISTDTVSADVERDITAVNDVGVNAKSLAKSETTATASVKGGEKADAATDKPASGDAGTVDKQVAAQGDAAKTAGAKADADAGAKLNKSEPAPKTDSNSGGAVSVAAAVAANVEVSTTTAQIGKGRTVKAGKAASVTSQAQTDAKATADGSQVDSGGTNVGVGAAVALNVGVATNVAAIDDNATVTANGVTVSATMLEDGTDKTSDFAASAKSGAGAANVGVAGSLAVNAAVDTTVASIAGDDDSSGTGANVDAGTGDVTIEAKSTSTNKVTSGADVKGSGKDAKVGVGASVGLNVAVNTTVAELGDNAKLANGNNLNLNAGSDDTVTTEVTGGASGAKVTITPLAAVSVVTDTTVARLGTGDALDIGGDYSSTADQKSSVTTKATGTTEGSSVAVGASVALTVAVDTVSADVERDLTAAGAVGVNAKSLARSETTATASVKGGEKADSTTDKPASGDAGTVDKQVAAQGDAADAAGAGAKTAAADKTPVKTTTPATTKPDKPTAKTSDGAVSVAAAVAGNVEVATTTAQIGKGKKVQAGKAASVTSQAQTDAKATADGSQVDSGGTNVGVGAAVALNVGVATNVAAIDDNATVIANGVTVSATMLEDGTDKTSDFEASAKSGAGAANVGVAGSLAVNAAVDTTVASIAGDEDKSGDIGYGTGASVDAGSGDVLIEAKSATTNKVTSGADVKGSGKDAKVGVGVSIGVNVAVNTTTAEIGDQAKLSNGKALTLTAKGENEMNTEVTGGASGTKVAITPVVAAAIAVDTTTARIGTSTTALGLSGTLSTQADETDKVTTKATGQAEGDVAVGASLAVSVAVDTASASLERSVTSASGVDVGATSTASLTTTATASAKGAKAADKDGSGNDKPAAGTTVDEQKKNQLDFAKSQNSSTKTLDTDTNTPAAETPEVNKNDTPSVDSKTSPNNTTGGKQQGKKVSVAAAIGVGVAVNTAKATVGPNVQVSTTGNVNVKAATDTNYATSASGEAVSDDVGVAAAVALTAAVNTTRANLASGSNILQAGDVNVTATSTQNRDTDFLKAMGAQAVSGAGGGDVAVAGALAVVGNYNHTDASIDEGATIGSSSDAVGNVTVKSDDTSKVAVQARAGALSKGSNSKAGIGASFAAALSYNEIGATVGDNATLYANSLTVTATRNPVTFNALPNIADVTKFSFDTLDPANYLGSDNYYTEAVAGAAAKGNVAVAGAFSVNLFMDTTEATLGKNVTVTTRGSQAEAVPGTPNAENLGVEVAASSDVNAISFSGAVAGAKKAGVGVSNTDIGNFDQTLASIGDNSTVKSQGADAGVKVAASSKQDLTNVSVSAAGATEGTGVAGVLGVIVSANKADASIGAHAAVESAGNADVLANNDTTTVMVAGGVAAGKEVGVGGSIAVNVLWNETKADIGAGAAVDAKKTTTVAADAAETAATAVVAGAGGGKVGVAASLSLNAMFADTEATVAKGAKLNTKSAFATADQAVAIDASDDTVIVGVAGGGAGGGKVGVGAALDTAVLVKTVKAAIADGTAADGTEVDAKKAVSVNAASTENIVSVTAGFGFGGSAGVGGAVSLGIVDNTVAAHVGNAAKVSSDGNVLVNAEDGITAVLTAGSAAGGGDAGVGGSLAVATLIGSTEASIGDDAHITALGNGDAAQVYTGETGRKKEAAKGLSVTAYDSENLITTVASGAGGGKAGVAATLSANVIAQTTEASIGRGTQVNETNTTAGADQQVRVKAVDETVLVDTAAGAGGGGSAGVGAAANVAVMAKTTTASIGNATLINAKRAVDLQATSSAISTTITAGFAGGGSAGVGGALAGVGVANTTEAYVEDGTSTADAAKINVSGGDLDVRAGDFATSTLITGSGAGGGAAGVGASLSIGVNASTTLARIGNYAETNASGTTTVEADATQNLNSITVAGAGGGSAGVAGSISADVVVSHTEAGIGDYAKVNQDAGYAGADQSVAVTASDTIVTVGAGGAGAGGGAAGVGGTADVTFVTATTSAYIGNDAKVSATKDVSVDATSDKYVNSVTIGGAGGGAAGVAGAVSVIAVGSLFDDQATSGLGGSQNAGDSQSKASFVTADESGNKTNLLGTSTQSTQAANTLDGKTSKLAVGDAMSPAATIPLKNTQAFVGHGAHVNAGGDVNIAATDKTLAIVAAGSGAGGGAAGVSGSFGVVLLHDAAEAFIADGAKVNAKGTIGVDAITSENVFNVGITGSGAGAASVNGAIDVNVVSSDTYAYIGDADVNQDAFYQAAGQSVDVGANSSSNLVTVSASGGGAGAAAVGGVIGINVLTKTTKAFIADGAKVEARNTVKVAATSSENIVNGDVSIRGAGAAGVGGVASANIIMNTTEAYIGAARGTAAPVGASVDSNGNVDLAASDDTLVVTVSAVGNGAGAAAVGADVGANVISNATRAYVADNSTVNARGNAAGVDVYNGTTGAATALPPVAHDPSQPSANTAIDINGDGTPDGNVGNGASFNVKADGKSDGSGGASSTVDPASQGLGNKTIAGAAGGIGAKGVDTGVMGLSIAAVANEKVITAAIDIAGAGAASVTIGASANIVSSQTEASIGNGVTINDIAGATGADQSVRLKAADNTFMVQADGSIAGAGAAGVGGAVGVAVVAKTTDAHIGASSVNASNLAVNAQSAEDLYLVGANLAVGGAAGVGVAVDVAVVTNHTTAMIGAGADIDASGNLSVGADERSAVDFYTLSGAGGIGAVAGAVSVGVIDNTTLAYVGGANTAADAATLDAGGSTDIGATSTEDVSSITVAGAGGGVGVAGAVGVKVVKSDTEAYLGKNAQVNQTRTGTAQKVNVHAADTVNLSGGGGSGAIGGFGGAGAAAEIDIVRNTTTAYLGDYSKVHADTDIDVSATSTKDVQSAAVALAGGGAFGISGAVAVAVVGSALDSASQDNVGNGATASQVDGSISQDEVTGKLGNSEHMTKAKSGIDDQKTKLSVADDLNDSATTSQDKTRAYVGSHADLTANGNIDIAAIDKTQLDLVTVGAAGGYVGIGGAFGVGLTHSTTEAFADTSATLSAGGNATIEADAGNVDGTGSKVISTAGAGGVVGLSAAVAVLDDTSTTSAYLAGGSTVAKANTLTVRATTHRKSEADTYGATIGALAAGASVSHATFEGSSNAYFGSGVHVGQAGTDKLVDNVVVDAGDTSTAVATATAGSAGIVAGSGADAASSVTSKVNAYMGDHLTLYANDKVSVTGTSQASTQASAIGVNAGAAAVGVSLATATVAPEVFAYVGSDSNVTAGSLDVTAQVTLPAGGTAASAYSLAASGGLVGLSGAYSAASDNAQTTAYIGDRSTVNGSVSVLALTNTGQSATATGISVGLIAAGADIADASSDTHTHAYLGDDVSITADAATGAVSIIATGTDTNYASATAGSGGIVAGAAAKADTTETSDTKASIGQETCDRTSPSCGIAAGTSFAVVASHDSVYNAQVNSVEASALGASGASSNNKVTSTVDTEIGNSVKIGANHIAVAANNASHKRWLGQATDADDTATADGAGWNLYAGAGGILGGAAGITTTTILQTTTVGIAPSALFHVLAPTLGTGSFTIDANDITVAYDKIKLDAGGAIAIAEADSIINATDSETVTVGNGTAIVSDSGDVSVGTRADVKLDARASANAYGLAGAPAGKAYANFTGTGSVTVGNGVVILAQDPDHGRINIAAGRDSQLDRTSIVANASVNLWNKTVVPINSTPDAQSNVSSNATLTLAGNGAADPNSSILLAAGDIGLAADKGQISQSAVGVGKDLYREALEAIAGVFGIHVSLDITGGSSSLRGGSTVTENGLALSGLYRESATQFDGTALVDGQPAWTLSVAAYQDPSYKNPNPLNTSDPYAYLASLKQTDFSVDTVAYGALLQQRIATLTTLAAEYSADPVASAAYNAEITFLQAKLGSLGAGTQSSTLTDRGAKAATYLGDVSSVIDTYQTAITGDINASGTQAQEGAVGALLYAYNHTVKPNNDSIDSKLLGEKNAKTSDADYQTLTTDLTNAGNAVVTIGGEVGKIGNISYSCLTSSCSSAPVGATGETLASTTANGIRTVAASGYLGTIQADMQGIAGFLVGGTSKDNGATISTKAADIQGRLGDIATADQKIATAVYNEVTPNDTTTLFGALRDAGTRQTALASAWADTSTNKTDAGTVTAIQTLVANNAGARADFDGSVAGTSAKTILADTADFKSCVTTSTCALASASGTGNIDLPAEQTAVANGTDTVSGAQTQKVITLNPIEVKLGNVNISADVLTGKGSLQAPGDAKIIIKNYSPAVMNIGALTVDDSGGNVMLNGFQVNSAADVQAVNAGRAADSLDIVTRANGRAGADRVAGTAGGSAVQINSYYDPGAFDKTAATAAERIPAPAPDIHLTDLVSNPTGSVTVTSAAGDIYLDPQSGSSPGGAITAGSVSIVAQNGDYVQSYHNGFSSVAGEPYGNVQGGTDNINHSSGHDELGNGILANGNVYISARYLNVNGLIQSGIADYHLDLGTDSDLRFVLATAPSGYDYLKNACAGVCTATSGSYVISWNAGYRGIDGNIGRWEVNKAYVDANFSAGASVPVAVENSGGSAIASLGYPDYGAIQANYIVPASGSTGSIELATTTAVHGGSITLFGQIINTNTSGGGQLNVLDGFGQINITNNSSLPITLKTLDTGPDPSGTGRGTAGVINLADVQYVDAYQDASGVWHSQAHYIDTTITRNNGQVTYLQTGGWVDNGNGTASFCDSCTFDPTSAGDTAGVGVNGLGSAVSITGSRTGAYDPQAGLRYAYQIGDRTSAVNIWTYSGHEFFGSSSLALPPNKTDMNKISSQDQKVWPTDKDGVYLSYAAPSSGFAKHQNNLQTDVGYSGTKPTVSPPATDTASARTDTSIAKDGSVYSTTVTYTSDTWQLLSQTSHCDWWLCITSTYTSTWQENFGQSVITTTSVKADNPIAIHFMGYDTPAVAVSSKSSIRLGGPINNSGGTTTLTAGVAETAKAADGSDVAIGARSGQSITYADPARAYAITSGNVVMAASGSIGGVEFEHAPGAAASVGSVVSTAPILLQMTPEISVSGSGIISTSPSTLTATAENGNVVIKEVGAPITTASTGGTTIQTSGPLAVNTISADGQPDQGTGWVLLEAQGDIVGAAPTSYIKGERIELTSDNGGLGVYGGSGTSAAPLVIEPGYTSDTATQAYYGLKARAQGDINLAVQANGGDNPDGNLLVDTVVTPNDVRITAPGQIIDNNPIQSVDTRTWNQLVNFWNSMELVVGGDNSLKVQKAEAAFQSGMNQDYRLYWQIRQRQADPGVYDPSFQFTVTPAERTALLASGMTDADIATFEANRTSQYHQLNGEVGALNGGVYSASYSYVLSAADKKTIEDTSTWTYSELGVSIPGLLKNVTGTNPIVKDPNVSGRNVTLDAGVSLGKTLAPVVVPIAAINNCSETSCLTDAEKVALAAAEYSDLDITSSIITVQQRGPLNFAASQSLSVGVSGSNAANPDNGNAYLASLGNGFLNSIQAPGEVRVKVRGSIINAGTDAGATPGLIEAGGLILEAANGGIGYVPNYGGGTTALVQPLQVSLPDGAPLTARAADDIDLMQAGDLYIASLYTPHNATIEATGSIVDYFNNSQLKILTGETLTLNALDGSIGSFANPLDVGVNPTGRIVASATSTTPGLGGVYLNSPAGLLNGSFNIGSVTASDAIKLSSDGDMLIDGGVTGPGAIQLRSGGAMTMTANADVHATVLGAAVDAGTLTMADGAKLTVDVGTIDITTVGDAVVTGIYTGNPTESAISVTSTAGHILAGHTLGTDHIDIEADTAPAAKLTMWAALGIGDEPLHLKLLNLKATSGGVADMAVQGPVNIDDISAADRVLLTATGAITGNSITSTGTGANADKSVSVTSTGGGVNLASVSGTGDVSVAGSGGVDVGTINTGTGLYLAGPTINANVNGGSAPITGSVTGYGGGSADNVNLNLSAPGGFVFDRFLASNATVNIPLGSLWIDYTLIGDRATFTNPQTRVLVDQHNKSPQGFDVQLYSGADPFYFGLYGNHVSTDSFVIYRDPDHNVITPDGSETSAVESAEQWLALAKEQSSENGDGDGKQVDHLVSYQGVPVAVECKENEDCPK